MDSAINEQEKKQQLVEVLERSSDEKVLSMLIDLKKHGELFYLNSLLNMLIGKRSEPLKKALAEFVSDLKIQAAVPIITSFVSSHNSDKAISGIVTASWQSCLDFSQHLDPFFQLLISSDYHTAFEAFTVIENNIDGLSTDGLIKAIELINSELSNVKQDKKTLLLEMVSVLDEIKRAAQ